MAIVERGSKCTRCIHLLHASERFNAGAPHVRRCVAEPTCDVGDSPCGHGTQCLNRCFTSQRLGGQRDEGLSRLCSLRAWPTGDSREAVNGGLDDILFVIRRGNPLQHPRGLDI
jgi:hypothetical protein